ncbi:MAG: hypothetical protein ACRDNG_09900 [Gaiellaceae bacterium]
MPASLLRLAFAAIGMVAMTYQFAALNQDPGYTKLNFFSFFTIQTNILAVVVLMLTAVVGARRSYGFEAFRGAVVLYMAMTGVISRSSSPGSRKSFRPRSRGSTRLSTACSRSFWSRTGSWTRRGTASRSALRRPGLRSRSPT